MKLRILSALVLSLSFHAEASFNRFWIGYKLDTVTTPDFLNGLNQKLLPNLITLAAGKGLSSYSPYVSQMNGKDLPDEIALITYESEETYKKIRATAPGIAYGDLHWELFRKDISKSTVPVQFEENLEVDKAYELDATFEGWKNGTTYLTIYQNSGDLKALAKSFADLKKDKSVKNSIVLVTTKYIYEYRSLKEGFHPLPLKVVSSKKLKNAAVQTIGFHEGLNVQF